MWKLVQFPRTAEIIQTQQVQNMLLWLDNLVKEWLQQTPQRIKEILSIPINKITIIEDPNDIKALIFEYILTKMEKQNIPFWIDVTQAGQYISDLLFKISMNNDNELKESLENPYYTYWMEKWYPKKAGDVSVYNLIFPKSERKVFLKTDDYEELAISWYLMYSWKNFAYWIQKILPLVKNFREENPFYKKSFSVCN